MLAPTLVTVVPPKTAKLAAVPSVGATANPGTDVGATVLLSIVTAARAKARADMVAPVVMVMLATAKIFPVNDVPVPSVAELPTAQNTLVPTPVGKTTDAFEAVTSVLPTLKT